MNLSRVLHMKGEGNIKISSEQRARHTRSYRIEKKTDLRLPMRDGICLATDVYQPATGGTFPAILIRTGYNKNTLLHAGIAKVLASKGFSVIVQDIRGRYASEGDVYLFCRNFKEQDYKDGYDTLCWLSTEPWCSGDVGLLGISLSSYSCYALLEGETPQGIKLRTMISIGGATDPYEMCYQRGVLRLHWILPWFIMLSDTKSQNSLMSVDWNKLFRHLPLAEALEIAGVSGQFSLIWQEVLEHSTYDELWESLRIEWSRIQIPILHIGGWYDFMLEMTMAGYEKLVPQIRNQCLIVGPWDHSSLLTSFLLGDSLDGLAAKRRGPIDFGPGTAINLREVIISWFDNQLKGKEQDLGWPAVQIFVTGRNQWQEERTWPPQASELRLFLRSSHGLADEAHGGQLISNPPGDESSASYCYDPEDPMPTIGGSIWPLMEILKPGPHDQRFTETRRDLIIYSSAPLSDEVEVIGPIKVVLYAASSAVDTDFTAKLVDVHPDGYAQILQDGILRASYRQLSRHAKSIQPDRIYQYEIACGVISHVFQKGHRIRLEISSSNFPKYDRNLNTDTPLPCKIRSVSARQTIFHTPEFPSHLCLPVRGCLEREG